VAARKKVTSNAGLTNSVKAFRCRTRTCAPSGEAKALIASNLGQGGKADSKGYAELLELVKLMKESNVWTGRIKGYLFRGDITTAMKSAITAFVVANGWQVTLGNRIIKYGTIIQGGRLNRKHLLIFGRYRTKGSGNKVYCSLTII
jgi:hypothetical protein